MSVKDDEEPWPDKGVRDGAMGGLLALSYPFTCLILRLFLQWLLVWLSWYHFHPSGRSGDLCNISLAHIQDFLVQEL